jgi:hypothetical protein
MRGQAQSGWAVGLAEEEELGVGGEDLEGLRIVDAEDLDGIWTTSTRRSSMKTKMTMKKTTKMKTKMRTRTTSSTSMTSTMRSGRRAKSSGVRAGTTTEVPPWAGVSR